MLDMQYIRENTEAVKKGIEKKGFKLQLVDEVLKLDDQRKQLVTEIQIIREERNKLNDQLKKARTDTLIAQSQQLKAKLIELEPKLKEVEQKLALAQLSIPNVPAEDVPVGPDESGNVKVREWGSKPVFDFEPKDHIELGLNLDLIDIDRGSKVAGYRGYYLKNQAVMYQFGIMRYALDKLVGKGFTPMIPPIVTKKEAFMNSGHFPWGEKEAYAMMPENEEAKEKISDLGSNYQDAAINFRSDTYLAGTAEVPLVSYHANEVLVEKDLPLLYAGFSPCYRREVGNYGKDTRGLYRVHEFMKIEQVVICAADFEESRSWHEKLANYAEEMLQELKLPYQVLLMCTGDMGEPQVKKYDIETWMPGKKTYGETMSDSIMGDFQSRRANIRYRARNGELKYAHMLNNTALASPRILVALWENYQQADGSIMVPEVLQPYVGFAKIEAKR